MKLIASFIFKDSNNNYIFMIPTEYMEGEICKKNYSLETLHENGLYTRKDSQNRHTISCKLCAGLKTCAQVIDEDVLPKSKFIHLEINIRAYSFNGNYGKSLDITSLTNI